MYTVKYRFVEQVNIQPSKLYVDDQSYLALYIYPTIKLIILAKK